MVHVPWGRPLLRHTGSLAALSILLGCATVPEPELAVSPAPAEPTGGVELTNGAEATNGHEPVELFVHVADTVADMDPALQVRLERLELSLLEREAENNELRRKLDATHQDVVRIMARLQQVASRAEAASVLAEAEVGARALPPKEPAAADVTRLLDLAKAEFDRGNYGGAAYLGAQARNAARSVSSRLASTEAVPASADHLYFLVPLHFTTLASATVRDGPGAGGHTRFTIEQGTPVRGYSYNQRWVYIRDNRGRAGWIAYSQLGRP